MNPSIFSVMPGATGTLPMSWALQLNADLATFSLEA
jgi:hypothetical protein